MAFNPLQSLLAGAQGRQQFDQIQAQQNLAQAAGQPGFNPTFSPELQQVAALSNDPGQQFLKLDRRKQESFFNDAQKGLKLAKAGKWGEVTKLAQNRMEDIFNSNGDPSDTLAVISAVSSGDFEGATQLLQSGVDAGITAGFLKQTGTSAGREKERLFRVLQSMPEGNEKDQFARIIGAEGKAASLEDRLKFEADKQTIVGGTKVNQKLDELKRIESETEDKRSMIELRKITIDETKIKNLKDRQLAVDKKNISRKEARNAIDLTEGLLKGDAFSSAFGRFNNAPPEGLRTQANIDARAQVDQVTSLISLEAREKLRGQGTITDSETATLAKSATLLANPLISDPLARKELRRVRGIFEDAEDRNRLKRETIQQQEADTQAAQTFNFDAQGNLIQ